MREDWPRRGPRGGTKIAFEGHPRTHARVNEKLRRGWALRDFDSPDSL